MEELLKKLQSEWEAFKQENDRRLKEIEAKGRADPLTEEKIEKHSKAVGDLQKQLDELEKKMARPGAAGQGDEQKAAREAHRKSFMRFVKSGETAELSELQAKAMSLGSNADGGWAVPQDLDTSIYSVELKYAPMRDVATVRQVSNEKYEQLVNIHGAAGGWVAEADARPATGSPQFAKFAPVFGELYANVPATQRVLDDPFFNLEQYISDEVGFTFGINENAAFTSGAGVAGTSPKGFLAYTPSGTPTFGTNILRVASTTAGTIVADTLQDVPAKILKGYRTGSIWQGAAGTYTAIRKLKDGQNRYLWEPSLQAGIPALLLGYPTVENEDMPAVAASANALAFGNFKRAYEIVDVKVTTMLRDPYTNKPSVNFYFTRRVGGGVRDTSCLVAYCLAVS
jgi:HK97 family phage major capsid protein